MAAPIVELEFPFCLNIIRDLCVFKRIYDYVSSIILNWKFVPLKPCVMGDG